MASPRGYTGSKTPTEIRDLWQTPKALFDYYDNRFDFNFDMAASEDNALCDVFFTKESCALTTDWTDYPTGNGFLNPPFSDVQPWIEKVIEVSEITEQTFVVLLPADTSVKWFKLAFDNCSECHFISGRISFINAETQKPVSGNNKGSVVFVFDPKSPFKSQVCLLNRDEIMGK